MLWYEENVTELMRLFYWFIIFIVVIEKETFN